jgi:hypothetical protein
VHQVADLPPGLYFLVRHPPQEATLRRSLEPEFDWERPEACPEYLPRFRLVTGDATSAAKMISCQQDIVGDSVFSLGMLAE